VTAIYDEARFGRLRFLVSFISLVLPAAALNAQTAWFIDGYHGGVHGHYPPGYTGFIVEQLRQNPEWKINLEIEPETWDFARLYEPEAYASSGARLRLRGGQDRTR
jgi:alpha-mannosidase